MLWHVAWALLALRLARSRPGRWPPSLNLNRMPDNPTLHACVCGNKSPPAPNPNPYTNTNPNPTPNPYYNPDLDPDPNREAFFPGVGNIYRAEILFVAGVHPNVKGRTLTLTLKAQGWVCYSQG